MIQAPVFHGHSFSAWVEFEENPGVEALNRALDGDGIDVRPDEPPTNIGGGRAEWVERRRDYGGSEQARRVLVLDGVR